MLSKLIQEQKRELGLLRSVYIKDHESRYFWKDDVIDWHISSLIAIIRNEIERKKGVLKPYRDYGDLYESDKRGYNTAITEDIAYWQNVLEELEKSV